MLPAADTVAKRSEAVISTIMERRSIRKYKPQPVNRDTMKMILKCGINAPNGMNKQSWEVRVVDNPEFIDGITAIYKKYNPEAAADASFKNMFRNAPTVVFIANDPSYDCSQIDCGLLGGNMILAAQSMGIGSCCLGGPARFMRTPEAAEYLKKLEFSKGYERGKFYSSTQHPTYMLLIPEAQTFSYLVSNGMDVWTECYRRDETPDICPIIADFFDWLDAFGLMDVFKEHWKAL